MASEQPSPEHSRQSSSRGLLLVSWLVAAAFAVGAIAFAARYYSTRFEAEQLSQQLALADVALKSARVQLEAEQLVGSRLASDYAKSGAVAEAKNKPAPLNVAILTGVQAEASHAVGAAAWDPQREKGVFTVENLPAATADQRYELWLIDSKPVSAGVFSVGPDGRTTVSFRPTAPVQDVTRFAVSREKNDGQPSHVTPGAVIMQSQ